MQLLLYASATRPSIVSLSISRTKFHRKSFTLSPLVHESLYKNQLKLPSYS